MSMDNKWLRNSFVYLILLVAVVALFFTAFPQPSPDNQPISINEVAAGVKDGSIRRIVVRDDRLDVEYQDNRRKANSRKDAHIGITQQLRDYGVTPEQLEQVSIVFQDPPQFGNVLQVLINLLPLVIFGGILLFMMRQAQGSNN